MTGPLRSPSVAGTFYPGAASMLRDLVESLFAAARRLPGVAADRADRAGRTAAPALPTGILVPHAGLEYSGVPAAAAWACLGRRPPEPGRPGPVVVLLGTNHVAAWLDGIAAWDGGAWSVPTGEVAIDEALAAEVVALGPPFLVDRDAHRGEHSIEVQLPLLIAAAPGARIVPLAVSAGTGLAAVAAGTRLGELLAARRAAGEPVVLAISSDMAHYPPADACARATEVLLPAIAAVDAPGVASLERALREADIRGLACGMCGIEPAVVGLAALRAMGATVGTPLAKTTSADAGGPRDRTVGYLAVRFDAPHVS